MGGIERDNKLNCNKLEAQYEIIKSNAKTNLEEETK